MLCGIQFKGKQFSKDFTSSEAAIGRSAFERRGGGRGSIVGGVSRGGCADGCVPAEEGSVNLYMKVEGQRSAEQAVAGK